MSIVNIDISLDSKPMGSLQIPIGGVEEKTKPRFVQRLQGEPLNEWIRMAILSTLAMCGYSGVKTYKKLKISERTFYRYCVKYDIQLRKLKSEYLLKKKLSRIRSI